MCTMDADALLCQMVPGALSHVPYADYSDQKELDVWAHLGRVKSAQEMQAALKALQMAHLREFFPREPGLNPCLRADRLCHGHVDSTGRRSSFRNGHLTLKEIP